LNVSSVNPETITFSAEKVGVCTNAFTKPLLPDLALNPGRGMVLITRPLKNLRIKGTFHYDQGYYYFRNVGSRVLYGGGRNLDKHREQTTDFGINQQIYQHLVNELSNLILPAVDFEIDGSWSGIMAFGPDKCPLIDRHISGIGYAVGLGGMGVALGSLAGDRLARILCLPENS
jgi:glycine/D-amino acid oxidase-like deaminating enzyme